jgi:TRAP-type C4-dicarboxylate transport system substrate-binding protein
MKKELNLSDKQILSEYGKLMRRRWMEKSTPEQRKAISEKARLAGLEVRRANAARRKAEKEGKE